QAEQQRLQTAIQSTLNDLSKLTALAEERYSADIAAIFSGHHTLLDDPELFEMACDVMREKQCSAAWAWHQVLSDLSQQYLQLDDPYLQARYIDIEDLLSRSLQHLTGESAQIPAFLRPTILVADVIYPSTVLQLDPKTIKGICLRDGSEASHPAIIAREMGLCWMCQQGAALDSIKMGDTLTIDCVTQRITRAN
ncbi:MAG: phosphoenolpyruvate-utilizing N-terminal domain-containing protein, partial [Citrobacter freundii]|nr:phosphoenolpyruvate-utilizing N-terminal domain-containing protein [Citrobacter freundii]